MRTISIPNNSTSNQLQPSAVFVGGVVISNDYTGISIALDTSNNCELVIEQSSNKTVWFVSDTVNFTPGVHLETYNVERTFIRVRLTNTSSTATSVLRLDSAFTYYPNTNIGIDTLRSLRDIFTSTAITLETPEGLVNGINNIYTSTKPFVPETVTCFINGLMQSTAVTSGNNTVTFPDSPETGDIVKIKYSILT